MGKTIILGLESSCDETAAAIVADGRDVLSSVIASQIDLRRGLATSPLRFELALTARDLAIDVVDKRRTMLALFEAAQAR